MRVGLAIMAAGLLVAGCSGREPEKAAETAVAPKVSPAAAPVLTPPVPPPGAEAVDLALKAAQEFNVAAPAELAAIAEIEAKYAPAARRALAAARTGDSRAIRRPIEDANAARKAMEARLAAYRAASEALSAQVTAASEACAATPELTGYAGCVALATEQTTLAGALDSITQRFEAAEAAWRQERTRLDEAAATVALEL